MVRRANAWVLEVVKADEEVRLGGEKWRLQKVGRCDSLVWGGAPPRCEEVCREEVKKVQANMYKSDVERRREEFLISMRYWGNKKWEWEEVVWVGE
jgi:hypothetical protein